MTWVWVTAAAVGGTVVGFGAGIWYATRGLARVVRGH